MIKFLALFFILLGILSLFFNISHPPGLSGKSIQYYDNIENRFLFGFIQVLIGVILYKYKFYILKEKKIPECTKCPKCKESFNYSELEKGKCKYCKDVDTIDIEEYYKKYPEELEKI